MMRDKRLCSRQTFVLFKKEVVQYFADDISNPQGVRSTLYENIAKDFLLFPGGEVHLTTAAD